MKKNLISLFQARFLPALTALGVVYGDIGTSPLYAVKEIYHHLGASAHEAHTILGYTSLVLWSLMVVVALKYVVFVIRADNEGEGGIFALFALLSGVKQWGVGVVTLLLLFSVGFLFGDGIITPAISVISAVEGLQIVTTTFTPYIVPITVFILLVLFAVQNKGTSQIGMFFGPVIALWFVTLMTLGLVHLAHHPEILWAFNPFYALSFMTELHIHTLFMVLGSVMLVVTGGEALYADMGHFGRTPIRDSWFFLVFPALLINYLGQGAFLLSGQELIHHNIFFSMVPHWALIPMVILATLATVIASQALITGAFSLVSQAISLGYFPFLKIVHTHAHHAGQIYVPFINYALLCGCIYLVVQFQSSSNLASAYGLAVSFVMLTTTAAITLLAKNVWGWPWWQTALTFIPFLLLDILFLSANSLKFFGGGYIPFAIGIGVLTTMLIWKWGKKITRSHYQRYSSTTVKELIVHRKKMKNVPPRSFIIMTPDAPRKLEHKLPYIGEVLLERYGVLPKHLIFLTVDIQKIPYVQSGTYTLTPFFNSPKNGSITSVRLSYGFMDKPSVEHDLIAIARKHPEVIGFEPQKWLIHVTHSRLFRNGKTGFINNCRIKIYEFLRNNSGSADHYFDLGKRTKLAIEVLPVHI